MTSRLQKLSLLLIPLAIAAAWLFSNPINASAQAGDCDIITAVMRTTRQLGPTFYVDSNKPYFYIDVGTQNCIGESIQVSLTEDDWGVDDDVNGTLGAGQTCDNGNNSCMDNRVITINNTTTANFTLALIAGEDECQNTGDPDCQYHVETWDEIDSAFEWGQVSGYDCNGACATNWQYLGIIPFGTTHANDPDANTDPGGDVDPDPFDPGGDVDPTATAGGDNSIINLNLQNPLAGTVDSLPEFFQKVVYIIIKIGVPLVAMAIVFSGFLFVTANGSDDQLKKAKLAFTFAVIGGLILLASWLVAEAIKDALTSLTGS